VGIYGGFVTATEAGALSCFAALIMGLGTRRLNWETIKISVLEGIRITCSILIIALGAQLFVSFFAFAGVHEFVAKSFSGTPQIVFLLYVFILYLILGMLLDTMGMLFLTIPVLLPILPTVGISPVLFCILFVKVAELGGITPPVGMGVYLMKSIVKDEFSMEYIFKGCMPFALSQSINFWILALIPPISLFLPKLIYG
jgi:TRAP-type C4-dicarboxylate transport system permease large subunit